MDIDKEASLKKHVIKNGINLFLGAGFSYHAYNKDDQRLPLGDELKNLLIDEFDLSTYKKFNLSQISNLIKKTQKGDFNRFLIDNYSVHRYDEIYRVLDTIKIKNIITLNIDNLLEKIFSEPNTKNILYDVAVHGSVENEGINFHKLHGSITYPNNNELLFTPEELSILFNTEPAKFHHVALKVSSVPTIFWGTQLEDANVISLLSKKITRDIEPKEKWIVVTPDTDNDANAEYFRMEGFNIIRGYTKDVLEYFLNCSLEEELNIQPFDSSGINKQILNRYFSHNYILYILKQKHPVRPLKTFFSGDDPVWSDIIDNNIIRLSYYDECMAKIDKCKNILITGGIGSGKSTIQMQLSIDGQIEGDKFYFESIDKLSAIKLNEACEKHTGTVYIFIDNLASNLDAYKYLVEKGKYHLICAERDIVFDSIKHLASFSLEQIIDITKLDKQDVQSICDLAHNTSFRQYKNSMSLFELAYYVWDGKKLESKIQEVIAFLSDNKSNFRLLEFFTLMVYVRSCGVSASMDMLLLYYADDDVSYRDVYDYVNTLSSMIDDEEHYTIRNDQDFYTLRSKLFSEISLNHLPSESIANVLIKFTNNVHKNCIVRYDVFKRKAYDADIARKAFINIEDGIKFYEQTILIDNSEYRYQQYALYLFRKGRLKQAWKIIEIAHRINPRNMTIKNTHAYILFKSNINIDSMKEMEVVKETLDYTFEVIDYCINTDIRKTYHIITYAENALAYYSKFSQIPMYASTSHNFMEIGYEYILDEFKSNVYLAYKNKQKLYKLKSNIERALKPLTKESILQN